MGEVGVDDRTRRRDELHLAVQPAEGPRDVVAELRQHGHHRAADGAGARAVDHPDVRVGAGEVEQETIAGLRQREDRLVDTPVVGLRHLLVGLAPPGAVRNLQQPCPEPLGRVVHLLLHHSVHHGRAVAVDELEDPLLGDVVRGDVRAEVEADERRRARPAEVDVLDVAADLAALDDLDRRIRHPLGKDLLGVDAPGADVDAADVDGMDRRARPAEELVTDEHG